MNESDQPAERDERVAAEARRRRRADIFGEVLPESTRDDRDPQPGEESGSDEWLRRNVPPHHG